MTEIDQTNGHPHVNGHAALIPGPREPQDAPPPGVWRGPTPADTGPTTAATPRVPFRTRVKAIATHRRTRAAAKGGTTTARFAVRQGSFVLGGAKVVARRSWDARSTARHQRMMRAAEVAGNHEAALDWEARAHQYRQARHERRMALLTAPIHVARAAVIGAGLLFALGILLAVSEKRVSEVVGPLRAVADVVREVCLFAAAVWDPALRVAPWFAVAALWAVGKAKSEPPRWLAPAAADAGSGRETVPDESAILAALKNLGISALNKAFKDGWQPRWISGAVRSGSGWHAQLLLPQGVTVEMVNAKKSVLASNLLRKPIEVWPTEPENKPGVLDLWVADSGALTGKVPPWPLLTAGTCDYFKNVPVAVSLRGESIKAPLFQKNYMVGGIMGTGKSSATRNLLLGAMLDPLVEIDVFVMAFNADYDAMRPRLRTLVKGDDDEQIEAALNALRELRADVTLRGQLLEDAGELALTRELAKRDPRMRPRIVVFDECHELFEHKQYGEEAAELAVKVMKKARKTGITLVWVTVSPTATSIPKDVTRNTSNRVAFPVGDHVANDGLLGTGKHRAGITATTLNPATDIGTSLTVGFSANPFDVVRWHYVRKDEGADEITPVVQRAVKMREGITPATAPLVQDAAALDVLRDVAQVIGDAPRMGTQDVLQRLTTLNPAYRGWTFSDLTDALGRYNAAPSKYAGRMVVTRRRVTDALAGREADRRDEQIEP